MAFSEGGPTLLEANSTQGLRVEGKNEGFKQIAAGEVRSMAFSEGGPTLLEANSTQGWGSPSEEQQLQLGEC